MSRPVACTFFALIFLSATVAQARAAATLRVHLQANENDTASFAMPLRSPSTGRRVVIEKVPRITEHDVVSFYPYQAANGSYGVLLRLDDHGRDTLDNLSVERRGANVYIFINGRGVSELQIDKRITDGKLYIASGLTKADLQLMGKTWRVMGRKQSSKPQVPSSRDAPNPKFQ